DPYRNKTNSSHYNNRHNGGNGNLWHKLSEDSYASVSVSVQETVAYNQYTSSTNNGYYQNSSNLYALVNGTYVKVNVRSEYDRNWATIYTYTLEDGRQIGSATIPLWGTDTAPSFSYTLYLKEINESASVYTYTYTDSDGNIQTIGTSTGANIPFTTTFYSRNVNTNGGDSRLEALVNAVKSFADAVKEKAVGDTTTTEDDIHHRIAMVGFAATAIGDPGNYKNTELFIGSNQYNFNTTASFHYDEAFQDMSTTPGQNNIASSINALTASGGTHPNHGLQMANGIFEKYPIANNERNRVVIVFTDGVPGRSGFDDSVASSAITQANITKSTYDATVYTVGVFAGADASSAGDEDGTETQKANWFMHEMSSNNGSPQTPSYYLSAADADSLEKIFQQISDQIESGSTSSTLTSASVVKDIIAPGFKLPANASAENITLETYACTGKSNGEYTWTKNADAMGATATVDGDTVDVTGFDFSENYVAEVKTNGVVTGYMGHKLVITFTVERKPEYLGGNGVETNGSAGIYENANAEEPIVTFPKPVVNVPINQVVVANADDQNVYLYDTLTGADLKSDATVTVGGITLDLTKPNYGLADWQTAGVDIVVAITDKGGNAVTDETFKNLTEDSEYNVSVTVSPKNKAEASKPERGPAATKQEGADSAQINVFKPVITFNDTAIDLGEPAVYADNGGAINEWIHTVKNDDGTETITKSTDTGVVMDTAVPTDITYSYSIPAAAFTEETEVKVTVSRGNSNVDLSEHVTFYRDACKFADCEHKEKAKVDSDADRVNFVVHINTFNLTITKTGANTTLDPSQTFIFYVTGPNDFAQTVVIEGNGFKTLVNLPVGTYTVTEDTSWSWRYTPDVITKDVKPIGAKATVTFENTRDKVQWLDGNSYAKNSFAKLSAN
ncbi:MAG: VWA domain-containing protein, partial [Oscillospiraceae bacterium]|nr:VWA domain-containing protein [Oscillospiraceae bacterium]